MSEFAAHIFRQYDIRGIVGDDLLPEVAHGVGRAFASMAIAKGITAPKVVVGMDNRPSSPALTEALIEGLRASGAHVLDIGTVPTPMTWWAEKNREVDGAIQVTGSHNPAEWNGIKMSMGASVFGDDIQEIRERIERGDFVTPAAEGGFETEDIYDAYVDDVVGRFQLARPVKVVVDCGNGSGALVAVRMLEALGAEVVPLYCESDGTFPNHHPDPTVDEYLVDMIAKVRETGAELGVAFDGDADRIGAVDENGDVVRGDVILLLFGLDLLERKGPGQKLVFDVKCSQVLPEVYGEAGGEPIMWMTGHSLMKQKMKEENAPLAGELSGHICVGGDDYLGFDDALYDACHLIDILARSDRPLSARVADFPRYVSTPELRIEVAEEEKFAIVADALAHFRELYDVIDVDGVRILFGDGWGLIRASNTQPVLVARYEARTAERRDEIRSEVEAWLRERGVSSVS